MTVRTTHIQLNNNDNNNFKSASFIQQQQQRRRHVNEMRVRSYNFCMPKHSLPDRVEFKVQVGQQKKTKAEEEDEESALFNVPISLR